MVVAHEADHLASGQLLDLVAEVDLHHTLPASAEIEHGGALAGVGQRLLSALSWSTTKTPLSPSAPLPWASLRPFRPGRSHVEGADSPLCCAHVKAGPLRRVRSPGARKLRWTARR